MKNLDLIADALKDYLGHDILKIDTEIENLTLFKINIPHEGGDFYRPFSKAVLQMVINFNGYTQLSFSIHNDLLDEIIKDYESNLSE